jgi:YD repeat-containing protein
MTKKRYPIREYPHYKKFTISPVTNTREIAVGAPYSLKSGEGRLRAKLEYQCCPGVPGPEPSASSHQLSGVSILSLGEYHVRERQSFALPRIALIVGLPALLICSAVPGFAQHTAVQDAGGGRKIELDYDAAGRVTEERTVGADGRVIQRNGYQYLPGFYAPQESLMLYWPDGKIKQVTSTTYDENSNFTREFIQVYDQSGKQVAGHRLTHDPETNIFHCYQWVPAAQNYEEQKCPAGEEGGGEGPEEVKKYTYEEVAQHLDAARETARQEQKRRRMRPMTPDRYPIESVNKEVGLVLPAQVRSGEKFSGSMVEDPRQYDDMPEVRVLRVTLPFAASSTGSSLMDWEIVSADGKPQRADEPVSFTLPPGSSELGVAFRQSGSRETSVSKLVNLGEARSRPPTPRSFKAAAICMEGQLCVVSGPFSGDSKQTFAAFGERPATVMAETGDMAYLSIPEHTGPGAPSLFLAEGSKVIALPVVVAKLTMDPDHGDLTKGQQLALLPMLEGPGDLPEVEWGAGNFPPSNLARARKLVPGFDLPRENREARKPTEVKAKRESKAKSKQGREMEEEAGGEMLLVIKNETPEQITLRGSKNGTLVLPLRKESFARGLFSYNFVVEAKQSGVFAVKAYAIPFLAPVAGQEFAVRPTASEK